MLHELFTGLYLDIKAVVRSQLHKDGFLLTGGAWRAINDAVIQFYSLTPTLSRRERE